jgi:hypothetical protein
VPAAGRGALWRRGPALSSAGLQQLRPDGTQAAMNEAPRNIPATATREDRLAARLRDNLKRRKAQARAMDGREGDSADPAPDDGANLA